jgi:squalene synthase HpnC
MPAVADRSFASLLGRYGPQAADRPVSRDEALAHCRSLAGGHYENFPVLSFALPRRLRQDFANVYAFCRWADDLGDEVRDPSESLALLDWWQRELDDCFASSITSVGATGGSPTRAGWVRHPVFVALRETIERHALPQQPFDDLISAFRQDQTKTRYETFDELRDYCRRSADPVGRIVLRLCDRYSDENVLLSDSVCTGLQLINFWQDVNRDFAIGRVYLPREDRERFGYSDDDLEHRRTTPAFLELMRFEIDRAQSFLRTGLPLADRMPGRLKAVIALFALGGLRIGDRIAAAGYRVWDTRPKLTKLDAARLLALATARAATAPSRA